MLIATVLALPALHAFNTPTPQTLARLDSTKSPQNRNSMLDGCIEEHRKQNWPRFVAPTYSSSGSTSWDARLYMTTIARTSTYFALKKTRVSDQNIGKTSLFHTLVLIKEPNLSSWHRIFDSDVKCNLSIYNLVMCMQQGQGLQEIACEKCPHGF